DQHPAARRLQARLQRKLSYRPRTVPPTRRDRVSRSRGMSQQPLVEMTGISKEFPGVKALSDIDFQVQRGEVHVLFGENGAGKSALISCLSGVYHPSAGTLRIDGEEVTFRSVQAARKAGIGTVFQEFSLVPTLSVFENVYLGQEPK